ncbi:MAG: Holliday junction branch migration protein RuvA, partial [Erysipelotrichia bacterium]|nr:Holliday junction branch migration protein RuvA [Erysipelotrichia bacterium]
MIAFICGTVASYGDGWVIIDHDGMGWKISYAHSEQLSLNQTIKIFTYMHLTENDVALYGFESREEQDLFLRLISVKGLGPKTAMNMLGARGADAIVT